MLSMRYRRALTFTPVVGVLVVAAATPAVGHVEVSSPNASPGEEGTLVFTVPNESESATSVELTVNLLQDTPFAEVSVRSKPGWTIKEQTDKLPQPVKVDGFTLSKAVSSVTWTAAKGHGIPVGEFDEFELSVGPFPDSTDPISFPAIQTYSDGEVVRWVQPAKPDGSEPEHPAPQLTLGQESSAGDPDGSSATAEPSTPTESADATVTDTGTTDSAGTETRSSDSTARVLGAGALVLGAAGLIVAAIALRKSRSSS